MRSFQLWWKYEGWIVIFPLLALLTSAAIIGFIALVVLAAMSL